MQANDGDRKLTSIFSADVAGFSRLMEDDERATVRTLDAYRQVLRGLIAAHGGRVVDAPGDNLLADFVSPVEAVSAAAEIQAELASRNAGLAEHRRMSFRIGINLGDVLEKDGALYGDGVNIAARLESLADPGGICISGTVFDHVEGKLHLGFEPLGERRVKNIARPLRAYRVSLPPGPTAQPVAATTTGRAPGDLPLQVTSFIGRRKELEDVAAALDGARVVTLTGVGGVGKTRLALEAAARSASNYRHGAWLCELAPVAGSEAVVPAVATALGAEQQAGRSTAESIVETLRTKHVLLIFDNCEHVLDAVSIHVESIIHACPNVTIMATSREPLGIEGEKIMRLPPLALGESDGRRAAGRYRRSEAIDLFVDRAQFVRPDFSLNEENDAAIAEICRRLDGVPLAIELAAARIRSMSPGEIAERLDERFRLLSGGRRTAAHRHQTLRAAADWSYDLLGETERRLFGRLSAFAGGFTLAAAESVCIGDGVDAADLVDLMASLVDKSMVVAEELAGSTRYRLLETLRQYARERLDATADTEAVRRRHARYFVLLAEQCEAGIRGRDEGAWLRRLETEFGNLRAAYAWAASVADADTALRLAASLPLYAVFRLRVAEPTAWAEAAIAMPGAAAHPLMPHVCGCAAWLVWVEGDFAKASALGQRALAAEKALGAAPTWLPRHALMCVALNEGKLSEALRLCEEQIAISRAEGDIVRVAHSLMAKSAYLHGVIDESQSAVAEDSLRLAREGGNPSVIALGLYARALALAESDPQGAIAAVEECLDVARSVRHRWVIATALTLQCALLSEHGDATDALRLVLRAIDHWHSAGDWASQWRTLRCALAPLARLSAHETAAVVHGASAERKLMGELPSGVAAHLDAELAEAEAALGPDRYAAAVKRGAAMADDDAINYAHHQICWILGTADDEL